jgi:serine/threonine-protein kinase
MKACPECKLAYPDERALCARCGTRLEEALDERIGMTLAGRYLLEEVIGQGGMATVYRARHALVDRTCAIKVVSPLLARDSTVRERFRREAKSIQKIAHPNVIDVQDQGVTEDGTSYIVMEFLEGASLAVIIAKERLTLDRALDFMIQLARGIARAHDLDVVHRDLKPENVFVTRREDGSELVKVLDFGIARSLHDPRLTEQGELFGTPQYMAPERIANADSGPPTDLYALGVMFYEMVTGDLPFDANDITTFFVRHLKDPAPDPRRKAKELPDALADLILRLLAKDPKARPVDAHRVYGDLVDIAKARGVPIPPDPLADPASSRRASSSRMPEAARRWRRRLRTLENLVDRYTESGTEEAYRKLGELRGKIARLAELDDLRVQLQARAETISAMGHEGRQRFGSAVDALGNDASRARDEARGARDLMDVAKAAASGVRAAYLMAHKEVGFWEGRSGFVEPYPDLAAAHRSAAQAMEVWIEAKQSERRAAREAELKTRAVGDLEFQIQELRSGLATHERAIESQEDSLAIEIGRAGKEAETIERELTKLADALSTPLRGRPDAAPLLRELESV